MFFYQNPTISVELLTSVNNVTYFPELSDILIKNNVKYIIKSIKVTRIVQLRSGSLIGLCTEGQIIKLGPDNKSILNRLPENVVDIKNTIVYKDNLYTNWSGYSNVSGLPANTGIIDIIYSDNNLYVLASDNYLYKNKIVFNIDYNINGSTALVLDKLSQNYANNAQIKSIVQTRIF